MTAPFAPAVTVYGYARAASGPQPSTADSGKNCTLKPVDAAKMPCMRIPGGVGGPFSPPNIVFNMSVCIVWMPTLAPLVDRFNAGQVARRGEKVAYDGVDVPG